MAADMTGKGAPMKTCTYLECTREQRSNALCAVHALRKRRGTRMDLPVPPPKLCDVVGCTRELYALGRCQGHYRRVKTGNDDLGPLRTGPTPRISEGGYVLVFMPRHPNANGSGYISEHRYIMAEHLGRPLLPSENVHHINGDRTDNRIGNLELWSTSQPAGQRIEDKVQWAVEILSQYAPELLRTERPTSEREIDE